MKFIFHKNMLKTCQQDTWDPVIMIPNILPPILSIFFLFILYCSNLQK